ncbi:DUF4189 domain-containing protein [Stenotrophomonas indicatrix]|uniref:DUF4189 domain-containing protein n=1 Tax=Stenotrophomonas indicatrix TaxID=2045451 RepID=UPI002989E6F3|nr:DUF4189 domain-containing protein [Stenotrophomonas indicatrix]
MSMVGCSKFTKDLAPILMLAGLGFSVNASAEGGCPAGSYPIGGQGVQGCAPIPSSGSTSSEGPRPNGRWIKTWGAIALSPDGASGASTGKHTKAAASREAEGVCSASGGKECRVAFTYKNQCAAASVPTSGAGGTSFGRAETEEIAKDLALKQCQQGGGIGCMVIFSNCSEPEFQSF